MVFAQYRDISFKNKISFKGVRARASQKCQQSPVNKKKNCYYYPQIITFDRKANHCAQSISQSYTLKHSHNSECRIISSKIREDCKEQANCKDRYSTS